MADNLIAGTASIVVDGATYLLDGEFKYSPSTVKREALMGMDGFHGWKETPVPGSISASIRDAGGLSVASFNAMRNVTIVAQLANGKTIIGRNMGSVDDLEVDSTEAKFGIKWQGPTVTETTT